MHFLRVWDTKYIWFEGVKLLNFLHNEAISYTIRVVGLH